ncbi:amidohydrolase family protein [Mycolicibacterium farcinogenes]|uniref:amidohydrolase family protein n=1 Tax=Mycolicibacterium farcinogenes TaxID=1802 RepID=UPI0021AD6ED4|nr:hypothetical protein [Mycolicibacterium farcinogenes]
MRIITVEERFEHPEVSRRVLELGGPPSGLLLDQLAEFGSVFNADRDAATRLGGARLAHMDAVGIDVQVVSHGNGSPSTLAAPESVELCRKVNNDLAQRISEDPNRFRGFATLPLHDPGAAFGWHAEAGVHVILLILSGALDRHPKLKLLSGHWGEVMGFWLERLDETFALVRPDHDRNVSDYY